jgi:hypothetical protein
MPRGVRQPDNPEAGTPLRLRQTLHEVFSHLRETAIYSGADAAGHLLEHVQRFGAPDLCVHGLPGVIMAGEETTSADPRTWYGSI